MITLHKETHHNGYTFRVGNHIGRIFKAETKRVFLDNLTVFRSDIGDSQYPQTDKNHDLSDNTRNFIDRQND